MPHPSTITISPSTLRGTVAVPPSKSLLHRGLICAALAGVRATPVSPSHLSDDIRATQSCLDAITRSPAERLDCGESGTTLRLLIPVVAALGIPAVFHGKGRLPHRPLREYAELLSARGVRLDFPPDAFLPLTLSGQLTPGTFALPGNISSQYISGLLLALPLLPGDSEIRLTTPLESQSYVTMTLDVMRFFGITAHATPDGFRVPGNQRYHSATSYIPEPDFSQAAFWQLAQFLGHDIALSNLPATTAQGDAVFAQHLATFRNGTQSGTAACVIDASQTPDIVPALAAAAAFSPAPVVRIANLSRLRLKESDRLATTADLLQSFGADIAIDHDALIIRAPVTPPASPIRVNGHNDHRIVMTAAILATRAPAPVTITDAHAVNKSYPSFFNELAALGAKLQD